MKPKVKRRLKITLLSVVAALVLLCAGFYIYTLNYYRADENAVAVLSGTEAEPQIEKKDGMWIFHPSAEQDTGVGFIFYPGGKVEDKAYSVLLQQLSRKGITGVLVHMPFNLAVFDINAADKIYAQFPEIKHWVMGGHSLGGAMASSYAVKNQDRIEGLVLLGAYPVNDSDIPTLVMYGSEDQVLDKSKLSSSLSPYVIKGGNHAHFGNYGEQKGDGKATITREEQQQVAVEEITRFIMDLAE
ncbi:alpha/beta hydrolase [Fontibacillus sp. BL9]|uniref:alpha/beta hydrolase n=1 Tax=Fontibacillus sp. BL9 TaxID=3389971 RepID=UPI00397A0E34